MARNVKNEILGLGKPWDIIIMIAGFVSDTSYNLVKSELNVCIISHNDLSSQQRPDGFQ